MQASFANEWLANRRRSRMNVYPDDWKQLPIPSLSLNKQAEFVKLVDAILAEFERWRYPLPDIAASRVAEREDEIAESTTTDCN